jgi:hypothetical protein
MFFNLAIAHNLKRACEGVYDGLLFMYNAKLISTKFLMIEIGATLIEFLKLDGAMENIRLMEGVVQQS